MRAEILRPDLDMVHYPRLRQVEVQHARQDDEVQLGRIVLQVVDEVGDDVTYKVCRAIALPVCDNAIAPVTLWYFLLMACD